MKLTHTNYFTNANRYLSNSKISDYLKSKEFFYRKHILGTVEKKETPALIIGKAVDLWLTKSRQHFEKLYIRMEKKNSKLDAKLIQLTAREYDEVVGICEAVEKTKAYKQIKKYKKQQILQHEEKIGLFDGLCGVPDFYKIDELGNCIIVDLKTSVTNDTKKYFYHAKDYGYFRQQAMYQMLLKMIHPEINSIESRHIVVEKDPDKIYKVKTFRLDQDEINKCLEKVFEIIEEIKAEKKWKDKDTTWEDMEELSDPRVKKAEWGDDK